MECVKQCFEPDRKPIDSLNNYYMKNSVDLVQIRTQVEKRKLFLKTSNYFSD